MSHGTSSSAVVCGLPGDVEHADDVKTHRNAKVGGQPVLPGRCPPEILSSGHPVCKNCGNSMLVVAQVFAPLLTAHVSILDRILMVWACPSQPCSNKVSGWRAFTCHVPGRATAASMTSEPKALSSTPQHTATDTHCTQQESTMVVADSWGATDDTWGSSQTDHDTDFQGKDAFDFSDLDCALTNASQHVPENSHKQHNRPTSKSMQRQHQHQGQHASSCCLTSDVAQPSLPGFYLHMTAEASGGSSSLSAEDQHIADLVAAYQDETQQADAPAARQVGDEWTGETYEEDKEGAFHKFCMSVQHVPQQCIRYSWGGMPLWPKKQKPSPGPCLHCGSQQVFEMQLLAPLMHFLEETCTWMLDDEQDCSSQIETAMQVLSNWQWLTVAVYSCTHACQTVASDTSQTDSSSIWLEQTVMLASEE